MALWLSGALSGVILRGAAFQAKAKDLGRRWPVPVAVSHGRSLAPLVNARGVGMTQHFMRSAKPHYFLRESRPSTLLANSSEKPKRALARE